MYPFAVTRRPNFPLSGTLHRRTTLTQPSVVTSRATSYVYCLKFRPIITWLATSRVLSRRVSGETSEFGKS